MARMRTAPGVLEIIKTVDPETEVTLSSIRRLIKEELVPVTCVGKKKLVDADRVIYALSSGEASRPVTGPQSKAEKMISEFMNPTIRKVAR